MNRFAIYFSPSTETPISQEAKSWLGKREKPGTYRVNKPPIYISSEQQLKYTEKPCHYGFHATIVPPFAPANGVTLQLLEEKLRRFVAKHNQFYLPPLQLVEMDNFFCLRPNEHSTRLQALAEDAIHYFSEFRRPPSNRELEKRRAQGLTANQERLLSRWGYPYVMEEFRFHLTLSQKIENNEEKHLVEMELLKRFPPQILTNILFDSLSIFLEENEMPMQKIVDIPLESPPVKV